MSTHLTWVPPAMAQDGYTPRLLEVLLDAEKAPPERALPVPGASAVYDRDGWAKGRVMWLLSWHHLVPGVASLGDFYVLTDAGRAAVVRYREAVRLLGASKPPPA